jgi:hypothetical protein
LKKTPYQKLEQKNNNLKKYLLEKQIINKAQNISLNLNGSSEIYFAPLAKESQVTLNSSWSNPAFDGAFLPESKNISDAGFDAHWRVLELNRNYPQQGLGNFINPNNNDGFFEELDNNWKLQKQEDVPVDWKLSLAPGKTCIYYYIRYYGGAEESKSDGKKIKRRSKIPIGFCFYINFFNP